MSTEGFNPLNIKSSKNINKKANNNKRTINRWGNFSPSFMDKVQNMINDIKIANTSLSIKLWKKIDTSSHKSVFICSVDGEIWDLSQDIINLIKYSKDIYTNNIKGVKLLFTELDIIDKNIYNFSDIKEINEDLVLLNYWDFLEWEKEINKIVSKYYNYFDKIYIITNSTNFINKYSLSHTNYWSLLYLWIYDFKNNNNIQNKISNFLNISKKIKSEFSIGEMISLSWLSLEFKKYSDLNQFIINMTDIWNEKDFLLEIIFETEDWYYNIIDYIKEINYKFLENKQNKSNITIFIYPKIWEEFIWYNKFNTKNNSKKIIYISSPLSNITEFTTNSINQLGKSKYVFWESIPWTEIFFKNLKITFNDKELLYWEDIEWINDFINENNVSNKVKFHLVKDVFPELIDKLDNSEQIHFLSDGWVPCVLDPWDNIKKYINLYYPEYSVIWIKWPNVISTVLLSCVFEYKYIYWAPLIYTIYPAKDYLKEIDFFNKNDFWDTLIIFYSFWKNVKKDFPILIDLFWKDIKIQIIGDIGRDIEFNKVFELKSIDENDINYISEVLENTVYLLKF